MGSIAHFPSLLPPLSWRHTIWWIFSHFPTRRRRSAQPGGLAPVAADTYGCLPPVGQYEILCFLRSECLPAALQLTWQRIARFEHSQWSRVGSSAFPVLSFGLSWRRTHLVDSSLIFRRGTSQRAVQQPGPIRRCYVRPAPIRNPFLVAFGIRISRPFGFIIVLAACLLFTSSNPLDCRSQNYIETARLNDAYLKFFTAHR